MEYLTTHDLVWINNQVTGTTNPFNYVELEEAMASQYQYGQSGDPSEHAASLLDHLLRNPPFECGNRRTAFIATLTFLNANGYATRVDDRAAAGVILDAATGGLDAVAAVRSLAAPAGTPLPPGLRLRELIAHECNLHVETLSMLASSD